MKNSLAILLLLTANLLFAADEKFNVLWIISDDLGPELGCYGYEGVATPNLDRLASEGMRFTKAFSAAPVCSSSRTSFITGCYQTTIGGFHHRTRLIKPLPDPVRPATELFRDGGYFVSNCSSPPNYENRGKVDYNFEHDAKTIFDGTDWQKRAEGQTFFAQIQIKEPHRPFVKSGRSGEGLAIPPFYPEHPVTRADWADYLASIEVLDQKVGLALDRLDEEGVADKTVVIFFGDHGRPHLRGKQWLYDSGLHVPLIIRWPGKIKPGSVNGDLTSLLDMVPTSLAAAGLPLPDYLHGQDIFANNKPERTGLFAARDRCGDAPDRIRSVRTDQWKYIKNFEPNRSYSQFSGYKKMQYPVVTLMAVMNEQGRLTGRQAEWFAATRPEEELYDLNADPWEMNNLAGDPAHAKILTELRNKLDTWITETGDQGAEPEGDAEYMAALIKEKWEDYARTMKKRKLDPELTDRAYLAWWKKELGVKK